MSFIGSFFQELLTVANVRMRFVNENVKLVRIVLVDEMQKVHGSIVPSLCGLGFHLDCCEVDQLHCRNKKHVSEAFYS